jgi:hypothetical protein
MVALLLENNVIVAAMVLVSDGRLSCTLAIEDD